MPPGLMTVAVAAAMQVGQPSPSETPNYPPLQNAYNQYGFEGKYEQRFPFDTQQNWVHGYHQEIPAYGGHAFFRPYNYKDVLSQSQTAAGWGMSPTMPYSQQYWHRYHDQATMLKLTTAAPTTSPIVTPAPTPQAPVLPAGNWAGSPLIVPTQQLVLPQQPLYQQHLYQQPVFQQPTMSGPIIVEQHVPAGHGQPVPVAPQATGTVFPVAPR